MNATLSRKRPLWREAWKYSLSNALGACVIAYCVVSAIAGQAGLIAYSDLRAGIAAMQEHENMLESEKARLVDLRDSLAADSSRQAIEAREIGYLRSDERIVAFVGGAPGFVDTATAFENPLESLKAGKSTGLPDRIVKILAGLSGLAVLFASLLMARSESKTA